MSLSLREFLAFLLSLFPYKACNQNQLPSLVTVYLLTSYNHYYCKCVVLFSITSIFRFQFIIITCYYRHLGRITAIQDGSKLFSYTLIILAIPPTWLALPPTWLVLALHLRLLLLALLSLYLLYHLPGQLCRLLGWFQLCFYVYFYLHITFTCILLSTYIVAI